MSNYYGPYFRWFAWHPVWTQDRGYRWLIYVWRRRINPPATSFIRAYWANQVVHPSKVKYVGRWV